MSRPSFNWSRSLDFAAFGTIFLAGLVLRLAAIRGDLWLDELWSLEYAGMMRSPVEVLTVIREDNSHPLNTLFLYFLGQSRPEPLYRLLSLAAGLGTLALAFIIARPGGRIEAALALLLFAVSYPQIHYSTEARGYAPAVFCAFLSFLVMRRSLQTERWMLTVSFWLSAILGFFSHLTFLSFYGACLIWGCSRIIRGQITNWKLSESRGVFKTLAFHLARYHLIPLAVLGIYAFVNLRFMRVGGGPHLTLMDVAASISAYTIGAPDHGLLRWIALAAVIIIVLIEIYRTWRDGSDEWILYLGAIFMISTLLMLARPPELLFPRYFLMNISFFMLLEARFLGRLLSGSRSAAFLGAALLALTLAGQIRHLALFFSDGRGHYKAAFQYMADHSEGPKYTVGPLGGLDVHLATRFHARRGTGGRQPIYCERAEPCGARPDWLVLHSQDAGYVPGEALRSELGVPFSLAQVYNYYGLSGFRWFVYRRDS